MPLRNAIDSVTARLEGVGGVANVYNYRREVNDMVKFQQLFKDTEAGNIQAWMVTREGTVTKDEESQSFSRTHNIVMIGFLSISDANNSEGTFQNLIEAICAEFDPLAARQYKGEDGVQQFDWSTGLSVDGPTVVQYGAYLCHAVKLTTKIREYPLT